MFVMAGLVPAIHALFAAKTWMPGTSPGMTLIGNNFDQSGLKSIATPLMQ